MVVSGLVFLVLPDEFGGTWAGVCMLSIVLSPFCLAGVAVLPPVLLEVSVNAAEPEPLLPDELLLPHDAKPVHRQMAKIIFLINATW